ncbi:MAG: flagellar basal body rod protein FlgC [Caulobacterales bacterium]
MSPASAIALSGMTAAVARLNGAASNLVNAGDESPVGGAGFQPVRVTTQPTPGGGVAAVATTVKPASTPAFDPASPVANAQGVVAFPNVDAISQITEAVSAQLAFAFSLKAFEVADASQKALLDIVT